MGRVTKEAQLGFARSFWFLCTSICISHRINRPGLELQVGEQFNLSGF